MIARVSDSLSCSHDLRQSCCPHTLLSKLLFILCCIACSSMGQTAFSSTTYAERCSVWLHFYLNQHNTEHTHQHLNASTNSAMTKKATTPSVRFSSTVTVREFDEHAPKRCSHLICSPPLASPAYVTSLPTRPSSDIPTDRKVQQHISLAAVLSFQNHLRRHSSDTSAHSGLLRDVSSKFSQRARDLALERARLTFCEVYPPEKGTAPTIPINISKFPRIKRKSGATAYQLSKKQCVSVA
jgi:hypothetical protein